MFLLLVTNKQSNILEDLDTLRLLSKVVPEYCGVRAAAQPVRPARVPPFHPHHLQVVEEDSVCRNAFELIFAFDEARTAVATSPRSTSARPLTARFLLPPPSAPGHLPGPPRERDFGAGADVHRDGVA